MAHAGSKARVVEIGCGDGRDAEKIAAALRTGGIAYISLKERPAYEAEVREDEFGKRMFYYYNPAVVKALAEGLFEPVHEAHYTIGHGKWFRIALRKIT